MNQRLLMLWVLFATIFGASLIPCSAQQLVNVTPEEHRVYEAVLGLMNRTPKPDLHVSVFEETLNSKCGKDAYPLPLANGCTFLWTKPDDASTVGDLLRQSWAGMDSTSWSDFRDKNTESAHLQEPISTPWKHKLIGLKNGEEAKESQSPDLVLFLSRVGFNRKRRKRSFSFLCSRTLSRWRQRGTISYCACLRRAPGSRKVA